MRAPNRLPPDGRAVDERTNRWRGLLPPLLALTVTGVLLGPRFYARMKLDRAPPAAQGAATSNDGATTVPLFYPRARWRLAQPSELEQVILWVSHIVITHRDSKPEAVPQLRPRGWRPDPPNPDRSVETALETAKSIAERLARRPEDFAAVAREFSDDLLTRSAGGSLGGVRANQLPALYLDALFAFHVGEVSRVIRTPLGFTVLMQRAPPPDTEVSAKRLLFRHRDAVPPLAKGPTARTRAEALAAAQEAVARLRSGATPFDSLLPESDSIDAMQPGDIGVWKLRDPGNLSREVEALDRLRVGEFSDPIETMSGVVVLQRTAVTARPRYAMQSIRISVDEENPEADGGLSEPAARAASLAARLDGHPELFDTFLAQYCCREPQRWSHGHGASSLEPVLDQLAIGQIAPKPIEWNRHYYIPKRLEPSSLPDDTPPRFELPAPVAAQLPPMVEEGHGPFLALRTRELAKEAVASMQLDASLSAELSRLFEELAAFFEAHPGPADGRARVQSLESTQAAFLKTLGPERYRQLNTAIDAWTTRQILGDAP
jgi:hypothetical protein